MKTCSECDEEKPLSAFVFDKRRGKHASKCTQCRSKKTKEWRDKNPDYEKERYGLNEDRDRWRHIKRKYGISKEEYVVMLESQGGRCAICGDEPGERYSHQLHVDHCHSSGNVRGLLCRGCNHMLGVIKDDEGLLFNAVTYLRKSPQNLSKPLPDPMPTTEPMKEVEMIPEIKSVGDFGGSTTPIDIRDLWQTPPQIYAHLNAEFGFSVDLAASSVNRLHENYITAEMNTLSIDWAGMCGRTWGWLNPPYSSIGPFVEKAIEQQEKGFGTVMLVPADTSVGWFSLALTSVSEVRLITGGRLSFIRADTGKPVNGNNKGSMLLIFSPHKIGARQFGTVDRDTLMKPL